ncbi:hypothetical protein RND81_04G172300 [Saponaria officinalis]|uniref:Receptor-like protein 12 n=1 Tax=Saponaria officinalis TaxID=3572 RepID=A0AAW1LNX9_SAPOF
MKMSSFDTVIGNMTGLKRLDLGDTFFDSVVFPTLVNLSSLEFLSLFNCELQEEVPFSLLNLKQLRYLEIGANSALFASFGLFNWSSPLEYLSLSFVNFSTRILPSLPGQAPYKLLRVINLSLCNLQGEIPSWMWSIPKLEEIYVGNNELIGVPSKFLDEMASTNLQILDLRWNNFTGNISLYKIYGKFPNLLVLILSNNNLIISTRAEGDTTLARWPMIVALGLSSCNLNEIPTLLKNQSYLSDLDLSNNDIHGEIPEWLLNEGKETLQALDISNNFIKGSLEILPWEGLWFLDVSSNLLHGALPIPPATTVWFAASNNNFTGAINASICDIGFLRLLDLSNNSLGGEFPKCLGNMSSDLSVFNLGSNNIVGTLPLNFTKCTDLQYFDLSNNGLHGSVSRSFAACTNLRVVNLRGNEFSDEFPLWLHDLPKIQVLDLSFNGLYGTIPHEIKNPFLMLQILDLSSNHFTGEIPAAYIKSFQAMMNVTEYSGGGRRYMGSSVSSTFRHGYNYSLVLTVSGVQRRYTKIINSLATLDVSNNAFIGEIPECIGDLVMVHSLNLSHNKIAGKIPPSIGNLKMIDSLDLSVNRLNGEIPQELASLTSLGVFNVSSNQLVGQIPQTNNFKTFEASSYQKNLGLCGFPLLKCGQVLQDNSNRTHEYKGNGNGGYLSISVWQITLISYGCGTVLGLAWGYYWLSSGKLFILTKVTFLIETEAVRLLKKISDERRRTRRLNSSNGFQRHA